MSRILWLNWSGGGNLPPSLGIARVLTARGHQLAFAGRPEMVPRVAAAGFRAIELTDAYTQVESYPAGLPMTRAACYLTSPAVAAQVRAVVTAEAPDLILIDGMFPAALVQAPGFGVPTVAVSHTFCFRLLDRWRSTIKTLGGLREQAGFGALPDLDTLWQGCDRILVTTLGAFDAPAAAGWPSVRHVGPVLEDEPVAVPTQLPWPAEDPTSLVLMSFSTGFEQRSVAKLQAGLDALATLPVHVVATTGGIVEPQELAVPANAVVLRYAAHDPILRRAALAVTHGGHGTMMRALRHGVPLVVIPGLAHDQAPNAATAEDWRVGLALPGDADAAAIRAAADTILGEPGYRQAAARRATALAGIDGAANAADEVEALLSAEATGAGLDRAAPAGGRPPRAAAAR